MLLVKKGGSRAPVDEHVRLDVDGCGDGRLDHSHRLHRLHGSPRRLASTALSHISRTFVVTCSVPVADLDELELTPVDHTISVTGPDGFRHELPGEADMELLEVELHKHFLEIRAPLR
jgi:hypothetical protein